MHTVDFKRLKIESGDCILDLGCGEGRHSLGPSCLYADIHVVGLDLNHTDVSIALKKRKEHTDYFAENTHCCFTVGDGGQLPFMDQSFDKIICSEVLEHIEGYENILREIQRVLKPTGTLVVSVPRFFPEKICWWLSEGYHRVEGGHIRIFKTKILYRTIEDLGFFRFSYHWAHSLHTPYWWLRCLFWQRGENFWPVRIYHRFLVWDLMSKPWLTQILDKLLNPLIGKSVVMYFKKTSVIEP